MVTSTGFVYSTANSILVVFCQQQSFLHKMLLWWYLVQELYDFFFRRFLIEIRSNPDVLVELPEGSVPVGAYPAHQVVLQLRNVGHCQLEDLLLKVYSKLHTIESYLFFFFWNWRIILFWQNQPFPSSLQSWASRGRFFPASEAPSPQFRSLWHRAAFFYSLLIDFALVLLQLIFI